MTDIERICGDIQRKLDNMMQPGMWERYTKDMESGEYREFKQYYKDLETILAALSEKRWIPVSERLPEDGELVWTWSESLRDLTMSVLDEFESDQVTHWMPLPEAPKGE